MLKFFFFKFAKSFSCFQEFEQGVLQVLSAMCTLGQSLPKRWEPLGGDQGMFMLPHSGRTQHRTQDSFLRKSRIKVGSFLSHEPEILGLRMSHSTCERLCTLQASGVVLAWENLKSTYFMGSPSCTSNIVPASTERE